MGSSSASLPASTSCRVATAVNILFIEPIRNRVAGVFAVPDLRSARPQASLEQNLAVAGDEHGPGELVGPACARRHASESAASASRFGHPVQHQIHRARRPGVASNSTRPSASRSVGWKRMLSTPARSGPRLSVSARRRRTVWPAHADTSDAHLGRLAAGRIARRGVEDVDQHIALRHRVDGRRGTDEVDPELLVRLGGVIGQGRLGC